MNVLPLIEPKLLREGATLGLVAPASPPAEAEKIPHAIERLRAEGFRVKTGAHLEKRTGYLAGTDEERAADFHAMVHDPEVEAIFALRGGYGSIRILPLLDYAAIRAHPKPFIGYSDNTALHHAILKHAGLVTYHGPNATETFLPGNRERLRRLLLEPAKTGLLFSPTDDEAKLETVVEGRAAGRLIGGNLTCLVRLIGTPYAPDFRGAILFLEDISERAYRVDGLFAQLRLAGALGEIAGLVLGRFDHEDEAERGRIAACLRREAERIGVPCVAGAPIGHSPQQIVIPHGVMAELDAGARTLRRRDSNVRT